MADPIRVARVGSREARQAAGPWIQRFARLGFASRGIVYMMMGWIAFQAAFGGQEASGSGGAFQWLLGAPLGRIMLGIIAAGLVCYTLWRVYAALANPERDSAPKRLHHAAVAVVHGAIALTAARIVMSNGASGGGDREGNQDAAGWTARAMELPVGRWIVVIAGLFFGGYGIYQIYRGITADLDDMLDLSRVESARRQALHRVCRFGIAARGVVFIMIGIFIVKAGLEYDPSQAKGFGGALQALREQPYGPWLLAAVAIGLISYGVYGLVRARYRVVRA